MFSEIKRYSSLQLYKKILFIFSKSVFYCYEDWALHNLLMY